MFDQVYMREGARIEHEKAVKLIRDLFAHFLEHPEEMPPSTIRLRGTCRPAWPTSSPA